MRWTIPLLLLSAAAFAASDPEGTVTLEVAVGKTAPIETKPAAQVICDDLAVVTPEFAEKGFVLRGLKPGTTLCGVWLPDQIPGGLYRVNVVAAKAPDGGAH